MPAVTLGDRPHVTISGTTYADGPLWDLLSDPRCHYTVLRPFVQIRYLPLPPPTRENGYNPRPVEDTSNTVVLHKFNGVIPDDCWLVIPLKSGFYGYGNIEDYFAPLWPTGGGKYLGIHLSFAGSLRMQGDYGISGGFSVARDFLPGAALAVAIAVTANTIGTAIAGSTATATTAATPWEIATAGMSEGMGTGGTIAATSGGILSTAQTVGGSVVSGARAVAGAATATRAAIDTIQAAANNTPQPAGNTPPQSANNSALLILGLAALLLT